MDDSLEFLDSAGNNPVLAGERCEWRKTSDRCKKPAKLTFLQHKFCGRHAQQLLDCFGSESELLQESPERPADPPHILGCNEPHPHQPPQCCAGSCWCVN